MTAIDFGTLAPPQRRRIQLSTQHISLIATLAVWLLLVSVSSFEFKGFFSKSTFVNLFSENAALGIAAIGETFVILSGGIDLSVGAMIGFISVSIGSLMTNHNWPPMAAMGAGLAIGAIFGAVQGLLIAFVDLPSFLVTLAGMFMARGLGYVVSLESIEISNPFYDKIGDFGFNYFPVNGLLFVATLVAGIYIARQTRFGRAVYAIGGNENSAVLMGVAVPWTKVRIYALSGICSAIAGIAFTFNTPSGTANNGIMLELDAIAAVVIGGTPLTGGVGGVLGTLMGVLILGTISSMITFQGTLSSWWTKIATGVLLLAFILLQQLVERQVAKRRKGAA